MKKHLVKIMAAGLILAVVLSNIGSFIFDGRKLDELRGSVLRLHILANSDSDEDQRLKLCVRDALLEQCSDFFADAYSAEEAELLAEEKLPEMIRIAEKTLRAEGDMSAVTAEVTDMYFDKRVYGDITMPAGEYKAVRIKIGSAQGHNWWCVMYPPLCIPAAVAVDDDKSVEEECFDEKELDMLTKPKKYEVRFALWDKIKSWLG